MMGNNPIFQMDIHGDTVKYANDNIKKFVEKYTNPTYLKKTRRGFKEKKNRNFSPEFAKVVSELDNSKNVYTFTDDASLIETKIALGELTAGAKDNHYNIIVPYYSSEEENGSRLDLFGGRGALLAEETYHAFQVNSGTLKRTSAGWVYKGGVALQNAEAVAKIWVAFNSGMAHFKMAKPYSVSPTAEYVLTHIGMVRDIAGKDRNISKVGLFLLLGGSDDVPSTVRGSVNIKYPPSYE